MKKLFFTLILLFPISTLIAQSDAKRAGELVTSPLKMGLYIAPSINSININDFEKGNKKLGFNYGYVIEYAFTENHSLESGFEISKKGGEIDNRNYKSHYLTFPFQVKMKSRAFGYFTYFAKTGPAIGIKLRDNVQSNLNNTDFGEAKNLILMLNVSIGAEYSLKQESSVYAELFIKNGITHAWKNVSNYSYETFLLNQFGVSLGFLF